VLLADFTDDEECRDARPLPWQDNQTYFLRRPPEAPEVWTRVLPRHPVTDDVEAIVLTAAADPDAGVRLERAEVWMLRAGVAVAKACERVQALVGVETLPTLHTGRHPGAPGTALRAHRRSHGCQQRRRSRRQINSAIHRSTRRSPMPTAVASPRRCG
jgi:hypothetical protein